MSRLDILRAALFTPTSRGWGLPMLLWDVPGVGKTEAILQLGRETGLYVEVLSPGERQEGAFGVTPVPEIRPFKYPDGKIVDRMILTYPPPEWTDNLLDAQGVPVGIVFVDETNTAPAALRPALMGLIHEKRIGAHFLGRRVRIFGAANPPELSAGGSELPAPVANRMGHLPWLQDNRPDVGEWTSWLLGSGADRHTEVVLGSAASEEARVMENWGSPWAKARAVVAGYIKAVPDALLKVPKLGDGKAGRAWCSPRSWENAARALSSGEVNGLEVGDAEEFVASFVGAGAASELFEYREKVDLPNPLDVMDRVVKWAHDPDRIDRTEVTLNACATLLEDRKLDKRKDRAKVLWGILGEVVGEMADLCIRPMGTLIDSELSQIPEARPVLAKMQPFVKATGLQPRSRR